MENNTNITDEAHISGPTERSLLGIVKWVFISVAIFGIFVNFTSLVILLRCKRIPKLIQLACSNMLVFEIVPLIGHAIFEFTDDFPAVQLQIFRYDKLFIFLTWTVTTMISLERVFVLESPRLYMRYVTKQNIRVCCAVLWIVLGTGILILTFKPFEPTHMTGLCWFGVATNLCYSIIITICCTRLGILCRRHIMKIHVNTINARETATNKQRPKKPTYILPRSTKMLMIFTVLFLSMNIPFVIEKTSEHCKMLPQRSFCFYLVILNHTFNPFIYVLRFKECKLELLQLLYHVPLFKGLEIKISALKTDIFEIPTIQKTTEIRYF